MICPACTLTWRGAGLLGRLEEYLSHAVDLARLGRLAPAPCTCGRQATGYDEPPPRAPAPPRRPARCHPDRPHRCLGLCEPCYQTSRRRARGIGPRTYLRRAHPPT